MGLVIDTNFFIDIENGRLDLDAIHKFSEYGDAYIAAVTASELLVGVHMATTAKKRLKRSAFVEGILASIPVLSFDDKVARAYAEVYSQFIKPRNKTTSNVHDLQIGATALAYGFAVLTSNKADFKIIPGLDVVSP